VTEQRFPAVPGMVELTQQAAKLGYAIIFLTGRGSAEERRSATGRATVWASTQATRARLR